MNQHLLGALLASVLANAASAHSLSCPAQSPSEWGAPRMPLVEVNVLIYPADLPWPTEEGLPFVVPDEERKQHGVVYQVWNMNTTPTENDQIECRYARKGQARSLRLDAAHVKQCRAELQHDETRVTSFFCD